MNYKLDELKQKLQIDDSWIAAAFGYKNTNSYKCTVKKEVIEEAILKLFKRFQSTNHIDWDKGNTHSIHKPNKYDLPRYHTLANPLYFSWNGYKNILCTPFEDSRYYVDRKIALTLSESLINLKENDRHKLPQELIDAIDQAIKFAWH